MSAAIDQVLPGAIARSASRRRFTLHAPTRSLCGMEPSLGQPVDDPSDATLMLAYAAGDMEAFAQLYARHRTPLYRFLLRQLRNGALADELFQDIWQRVVAHRAEWKPDAPFTGWLYRIAHNRLNDYWRAQKHRPPAPEIGSGRGGSRKEATEVARLEGFEPPTNGFGICVLSAVMSDFDGCSKSQIEVIL